MALRVTPQLFIAQTLRNAQTHNAKLARLQEQISSGVRISRPSDDPAGVRRLLAQKAQEGQFDTQLANIQDVRGRLNLGVTQLLEVKSVLQSAKNIALEGNQDYETKEILALEIESLIDRMLAVANTEDDGRYIFSGTATQSPPFQVAESSESISSVQYTGTDSRGDVIVAPNVTADVYYAGSEVFQPSSREASVFIGDTGAAAGTGTDSGIGQSTLLVQHTITTFAAGSGVQVGTSSPTGDTVIGAAGTHVLTINDTSGTGASGTISLNGGAAITFSSTDTDLQVVGPSGDVVFVDTTNITAGFSGDIAITADGFLSTDDGVTTVPIDFTANQVVIDGTTGTVTNIDSSGIARVGSEQIEYRGTAGAFEALMELRDDLRNTRNLSETDFHAAMTRHIEDLTRLHDHILNVVGEQSVALENLDSLESRAQDLKIETQIIISELESTDISEAAIRLQAETNLLEFTYASSVGLLSTSLLDFIR